MPPGAGIVFDRFHVFMHLDAVVDKVHRAEHRELSAAGNLALLGTKYAWLKTHGDMRLKSAVEFRGLLPMVKGAEMLRRHWKGPFAHLFHPITNAAAEGLNSRIQALRVAARGLPKYETFRARILFHLGKLDLYPA